MWFTGEGWAIYPGDNIDVVRTLPDASVDSCVTDSPYGIRFMGKRWDHDVPSIELWKEVLRVLKPGGHLLSFFGTRTYHRGVVAIEDAGFEIRDQIAWLYGQGMPKAFDVSKKMEGSAAAKWRGWAVGLKPAMESIVVARKPLIGTVAQNVLEHGTGALNIDGCRVPAEGGSPSSARRAAVFAGGKHPGHPGEQRHSITNRTSLETFATPRPGEALGRWPANLAHDGSDEVLKAFARAGESTSRKGKPRGSAKPGDGWGMTKTGAEYDDAGSPARFFYCSKVSRAERNGAKHPTMKPLKLMRYLVRLVTPPGGLVLDPFLGSGTTAVAAVQEGFRAYGIEREPLYFAYAVRRLLDGK